MPPLDGTTEEQEPVVDDLEEQGDQSQDDITESAEQGGDDDKWLGILDDLKSSGLEPDVVVKNAKQYTQTRQQFSEERSEIEAEKQRVARALEIQAAFDADPDFAAHVMGYEKPEKSAEEIAQAVDQRLSDFEARMQTERALSDLHGRVTSEGKPDFEDQELIDFCISHQIGDLDAAYVALKHDAILKSERDKLLTTERDKRAKGVVTLPVGSTGESQVPSLEEMQSMSTEKWRAFRGLGK